MVKEKNAPALHIDKGPIDHAVASSGLSYTNCDACGKQSNGLREFYPFIRMKVVVEKGVKILTPHYGSSMMLCYPCMKQAVKIDGRKK